MFEIPLPIYEVLAFGAIAIFVAGIFAFIYERFWGRCRRRVIIWIISVYVIGLPTALGVILTLFTVAT